MSYDVSDEMVVRGEVESKSFAVVVYIESKIAAGSKFSFPLAFWF